MKKVLTLVIILVLSTASLGACASNEKNEEQIDISKDDLDDEKEISEEDIEFPEEEVIRVGILLRTLSNPFWVEMAEGIKEEAKRLDIEVDIQAIQSEEDINEQLGKMYDMLSNEKIDGIGIAPVTATNLINGVVFANNEDIPVVNIGAIIDPIALKEAGGYIVGSVNSDNFKIGQIGAQSLMDTIGPEGGKIAIIEGSEEDISSNLRRDGAIDAIEKSDNFELGRVQEANWDRKEALGLATNIINRNPEVKGFFVVNEIMALGVLQAIKNTDMLGKVHLVGTDISDETAYEIRAGNMSTVIQKPREIGARSLRILYDAIKADEAGSIDYQPVAELVDIRLINQDTKEEVE